MDVRGGRRDVRRQCGVFGAVAGIEEGDRFREFLRPSWPQPGAGAARGPGPGEVHSGLSQRLHRRGGHGRLRRADGPELQPVVDGKGLEGLGADSKKKSLTATEQLAPEIQALRLRFVERQGGVDPARLVFIDEAGSHIAMARDWAWSLCGQRAHAVAPRNRGTVTTMIGAMGLDGVRAMMTVEGGTDEKVFEVFVDHFLVPKLRLGDIVVLDNLGAHRVGWVRRRIEAAGASVWYLPPYSPDLNPIELCWSKLKALLKTFAPRTREALDRAIALALEIISPGDAEGWFKHCGYLGQIK